DQIPPPKKPRPKPKTPLGPCASHRSLIRLKSRRPKALRAPAVQKKPNEPARKKSALKQRLPGLAGPVPLRQSARRTAFRVGLAVPCRCVPVRGAPAPATTNANDSSAPTGRFQGVQIIKPIAFLRMGFIHGLL